MSPASRDVPLIQLYARVSCLHESVVVAICHASFKAPVLLFLFGTSVYLILEVNEGLL